MTLKNTQETRLFVGRREASDDHSPLGQLWKEKRGEDE